MRDWICVRDHCCAVWTIMRNGNRGETYNIGGNNEMENIRTRNDRRQTAGAAGRVLEGG